MNANLPNLRTLLIWAEQAEQGRSSDELQHWIRSSEAANECWRRLLAGLHMLRDGVLPAYEPTLPPELVARYIDGVTNSAEDRLLEQTCWDSPADLVEVVSGLRFAREQRVFAASSPAFTQRLKSLAAAPGGWPSTVPVTVFVAPAPAVLARRRTSLAATTWPLVAGAVVVAALVVFGVVWFVRTSAPDGTPPPAIAQDSPSPRASRRDDFRVPRTPGNSASRDNAVLVDGVRRPETPHNVTPRPDRPEGDPPRLPSESIVKSATDSSEQGTQPALPKPPPPSAPRPDARPSPLELAVKTEMGAVLVQALGGDVWRVGRGSYSLERPLSIVSLADSWATADIAGIGTFVLDGGSSATVSQGRDHTIHVTLDQGHVGLHGLVAKSKVHFESAGGTWEATGVGDYSTLAVVQDPDATDVFVSAGSIAIGRVSIGGGRVTTLRGGIPSAPQLLGDKLSAAATSFGGNPYDPSWLKPPAEKRRKDWQTRYGKLVDRLAEADDAGAEIQKLRAATQDGRQSALLARWNLALVSDRPAALWRMLNDRQKSVRLAGAQQLLELPARDGRLRVYLSGFQEYTDDATAQRLIEWSMRARHGNGLSLNQAQELVDGLNHPEIAVRQMAGLLLEHHTRDAFRAARRKPPAFEADDSPSNRSVAQAQWKIVIAQIYPARPRQLRGPLN